MSKFWQKKYISKHTGAEIDEAVEAVLDGDMGTTVVANPTLAGTEAALTGLQVDETKYKVGGGMDNPMTAAGDLIVGGADGAPDKLAKGTDGKVLKMVSGAPAWSDDVGISQTDADLRYLQLSGGTMKGSIKLFSGNSLLTADNKPVIAVYSGNRYITMGNGSTLLARLEGSPDYQPVVRVLSVDHNILSAYNTSANPTLAGTEAALTSLKINGTSYKNQPSSMSYLTTAPAADNPDGIKIVVLSSEPATKYNGYLYIITA